MFNSKIKKIIKGETSKYNLFLLGGETFVKVHGFGKGGRNEEAVLGALRFIKNKELFSETGTGNTVYLQNIKPYVSEVSVIFENNNLIETKEIISLPETKENDPFEC